MSNAYYNKAETVEWGTPQQFFDNMNDKFGQFTLDASASNKNHKCENYFTKEDNGLEQQWSGRVWCNPPYGHSVGKWVEKAVEQVQNGNCLSVTMLLCSTTDVKWFHDWAWGNCAEMVFVKGRMCFDKGDGQENPAVFPSIVIHLMNRLDYASTRFTRVDRNGKVIV